MHQLARVYGKVLRSYLHLEYVQHVPNVEYFSHFFIFIFWIFFVCGEKKIERRRNLLLSWIFADYQGFHGTGRLPLNWIIADYRGFYGTRRSPRGFQGTRRLPKMGPTYSNSIEFQSEKKEKKAFFAAAVYFLVFLFEVWNFHPSEVKK